MEDEDADVTMDNNNDNATNDRHVDEVVLVDDDEIEEVDIVANEHDDDDADNETEEAEEEVDLPPPAPQPANAGAALFHPSRFPSRDLVERGDYRGALTHLQTYPYEMTLCNASNYNMLHDMAFRPPPPVPEEEEALVQLILAQGGAQSLLGDVNAAGYSTWHDVVCTQIGEPSRHRFLRVILTARPHFVYDMPLSAASTPNHQHKTALEWFSQHWKRTMKGSSGRRLRRILSQWDGMGYLDDAEIDKDEDPRHNNNNNDDDSDHVESDDEDEDEYQFVPQTYQEYSTTTAAANPTPNFARGTPAGAARRPFHRHFWSPHLAALVERYQLLLHASSRAIVHPPPRPLHHQSLHQEEQDEGSTDTSQWSLLLHMFTCRCPLPLDFLRLMMQSGDIPEAAPRQRDHCGELPLTLLLHSVPYFWGPCKRALVGPILQLLTRQFPGTSALPAPRGLPLHQALKQQDQKTLSWNAELSIVVKDYPPAVEQRDAETQLYPFFLAGQKLCRSNKDKNEETTRLVMDAAFELLRYNPALIIPQITPQSTTATFDSGAHKKMKKMPSP